MVCAWCGIDKTSTSYSWANPCSLPATPGQQLDQCDQQQDEEYHQTQWQ